MGECWVEMHSQRDGLQVEEHSSEKVNGEFDAPMAWCHDRAAAAQNSFIGMKALRWECCLVLWSLLPISGRTVYNLVQFSRRSIQITPPIKRFPAVQGSSLSTLLCFEL